ncbi:MAG: lactonase family protein [Phycisphaeraceae bacterium]
MKSTSAYTNVANQLGAVLLLLACVAALTACKTATPVKQVLYVTCNQGQHVLTYAVDNETGRLTQVQSLELPGRGGPLALSPDDRTLYAALGNPPRLLPMPRDTTTGELSMLEPTAVPAHPTYLDIDATGNYAITASYGAGEVHTFAINADRTVAEGPVQTTKTQRTAHASLIDPSNRFVYIPHTVPNAIYQFRFDQATGRLSPNQPIVVKGAGSDNDPQGPRHYTYHPTLGVVYVVNELDSSVSAYAWDKQTGRLQRFQSLSTLPERWEARNTCADIHVTPDGKFLYASNRGHDSIAAYRLDEDGHMSLIDWFPTEAVPREFAIDLNGRYLYAAGLRSNKLAAFSIDPLTGRLDRIGTYDTPEGPIWVEPAKVD